MIRIISIIFLFLNGGVSFADKFFITNDVVNLKDYEDKENFLIVDNYKKPILILIKDNKKNVSIFEKYKVFNFWIGKEKKYAKNMNVTYATFSNVGYKSFGVSGDNYLNNVYGNNSNVKNYLKTKYNYHDNNINEFYKKQQNAFILSLSDIFKKTPSIGEYVIEMYQIINNKVELVYVQNFKLKMDWKEDFVNISATKYNLLYSFSVIIIMLYAGILIGRLKDK